MHSWLTEDESNTLGQVAGKITAEDYEAFLPRFESAIQTHGKIRVLIQMEQASSSEPAALWQELKFDSKHLKDVERCALVGDSAPEKWMAKLSATSGRPGFYSGTPEITIRSR